MKRFLLLFLLTSPMWGKTVVQTTGPCKDYAAEVEKTITGLKKIPEVRIVIACDDVTWHYLQAKGDAEKTNTAFTNIKAHLTILRGKVASDPIELRRVLSHEFDHIRCQCSLGE